MTHSAESEFDSDVFDPALISRSQRQTTRPIRRRSAVVELGVWVQDVVFGQHSRHPLRVWERSHLNVFPGREWISLSMFCTVVRFISDSSYLTSGASGSAFERIREAFKKHRD